VNLTVDDFWTAGVKSSKCPGEFVWHPDLDFLRTKDLIWVKNLKPWNEIGSCIFLERSSSRFFKEMLLNGGSCDSKKKFICEVS